MRLSRRLALGAIAIVLIGACGSGGGSKPTLKIGSVKFDEARVMAEIYAQALEAKGYTVDRTGLGLGDRAVLAPAIESGQIDMQPEYIGSRLTYEIAHPAAPSGAPTSGPAATPASSGGPTSDSAANLQALQVYLTTKNLTALNYTPAIDTNAFVVRRETADELNLSKMSDTAAVQAQLRWGLATDCLTNALCGRPGGALEQYGITQDTIAAATLLSACDTPMADALKNRTIDVAELCSTQPDILVNGWVVLEDDKRTQPADNIAPVVRNEYLAKVNRTEFDKILNDVSAQVDTQTLADLYKQVNIDHKDPKDVASAWLKSKGFVQ